MCKRLITLQKDCNGRFVVKVYIHTYNELYGLKTDLIDMTGDD